MEASKPSTEPYQEFLSIDEVATGRRFNKSCMTLTLLLVVFVVTVAVIVPVALVLSGAGIDSSSAAKVEVPFIADGHRTFVAQPANDVVNMEMGLPFAPEAPPPAGVGVLGRAANLFTNVWDRITGKQTPVQPPPVRTKIEIGEVQMALAERDFDVGNIDGIWFVYCLMCINVSRFLLIWSYRGPKTQAAWNAFAISVGLSPQSPAEEIGEALFAPLRAPHEVTETQGALAAKGFSVDLSGKW